MTHKRKGQLAESPEWRKHLRPFFKRFYWKLERLAEKEEIKDQLGELLFDFHDLGFSENNIKMYERQMKVNELGTCQ